MPRYTAESKERVRDAVDFVELVSAKTELRKAGPDRYEGLCPFHDERTPSFGINPTLKVYHCFGCEASGDLFTFVRETEGLDFAGALEALADRFGVQLETEGEDPAEQKRRKRREGLLGLLDWAANHCQTTLADATDATAARDYLAGRGLAAETLELFRVGYAHDDWNALSVAAREQGYNDEHLMAVGLARRRRDGNGVYDQFRDRIMFPLCDIRGRVLGFGGRRMSEDPDTPKYINTSDGEIYHKGHHLYGAHLARAAAAKAGETILCEGYTDVLAMHQVGFTHTVGQMGTALTEQQVDELARMASRVLLCLDADSAGQQAMLRAERHARTRNLEMRVVMLPDGRDPADLLADGQADVLREAVGHAVPFARFQVESIIAAANTSTPEGKDEAISRLQPVIGPMPDGATRQDLLRLTAGRLELDERLVTSMLTPIRDSAGAAPTKRSAPRASPPTSVRSRVNMQARSERTFLGMCLAAGAERGTKILQQIDPEILFADPLTRQACLHLREHLPEETPLATNDEQLVGVLAEIAIIAERDGRDGQGVDTQLLQLRLAAVDRRIRAPRAPGGNGVSVPLRELAQEREQIKRQLDEALDHAEAGT